MPRIQSEDKTKEAVFSFRLRVDVHAQMVAYGAFLNPDDPSSKDYVVTELFRESVKGDKEFAAYWEQNKARFLASQEAEEHRDASATTPRGGCVATLRGVPL
jgi:hypothetical protein